MRRLALASLVALMVLSVVRGARAGGPFVVDATTNSGKALQWTDLTLSWSYDDGPLSPTVNNAEVVGWLHDAMDAWAQSKLPDPDDTSTLILTTSVMHSDTGTVGEDITVDNLEYYLSEESGKAGVIAFDDDGTIMEALGYDPEGTLGLSQPLAVDASGLFITRGIIILNGKILTYLATKGDAEQLFRSALLHEVGHLFNLDHTQVNLDLALACELGGTCDGSQYIPTMFPELKTYRQETLSRDDRITISWIYPNADFQNKFCTITGEILDENGRPLQGVNVIARRAVGTDEPRVDVRSMVSGVLYPACVADGHYFLHGILRGEAYIVSYEQLSQEYTGASDFEPLPNPPSGFESGIITKGGDTTVSCESGGEVITMDTVQLEVPNPCETLYEPGGEPYEPGDVTAKAGKTGCALADSSSAGVAVFIAMVLLSTLALLALSRRRGRRKGSCQV